jgi:hypothetical protein
LEGYEEDNFIMDEDLVMSSNDTLVLDEEKRKCPTNITNVQSKVKNIKCKTKAPEAFDIQAELFNTILYMQSDVISDIEIVKKLPSDSQSTTATYNHSL